VRSKALAVAALTCALFFIAALSGEAVFLGLFLTAVGTISIFTFIFACLAQFGPLRSFIPLAVCSLVLSIY